MVDSNKKFAQQIEINTIASSLGFFSDKMRKYYHEFITKYPEQYNHINNDNLPFNKPQNTESIADSMLQAIKLFSPR